jgi:CheY-like chemotaxis protein
MESATVLIADNNPTALMTSSEYFTQEGVNVIAAKTLDEAHLILKHGRHKLDAAILDGRLTEDEDDKDRSGWELAEEILTDESGPPLPIFIYSRFLEGVSENAPHSSDAPDGAKAGIILVSKEKGLQELAGKVREQIKIKNEATQAGKEIEDGRNTSWSKQHKAFVTLVTLLLALVCGSAALLFAEPKLLVCAAVFTVIAVVFMGSMLE